MRFQHIRVQQPVRSILNGKNEVNDGSVAKVHSIVLRGFAHVLKHDGYRLQIHVRDGPVRLYTA